MNDEQIQKAINYNNRQGYTETEIQMVEKTVGSEPNATWDEQTVVLVAEWQRRRGLDVDGMVGPNTWSAIKKEYEEDPYRPPPISCKPVHGIWVDDRFRIKKPEVWDEMLDHGVTSIALMCEGHSAKWDPYYDEDDLELLCKLAEDRGMVVGLTDWPRPNPQWIREMHAWMKPMYERFPLAFSESDLEGNWLRSQVKGFNNIDQAGDALVAAKLDVVGANGARFETTTYTAHAENGSGADVAPHAHRVFGQAYSVRERNKRNPETGKYDVPWDVPWSHTYGPAKMQKHTLDKSLEIPGIEDGTPSLGCGLAAYDQKWPGRMAEEAMRTAYDAAMLYNPAEVRWWSFKWVFGKFATAYGRKFLKSIA